MREPPDPARARPGARLAPSEGAPGGSSRSPGARSRGATRRARSRFIVTPSTRRVDARGTSSGRGGEGVRRPETMNLDTRTLGPRLQELEVGLCRRAVRIQDRRAGLAFFRTVSRLGDGGLWIALAGLLAVAGGERTLATVARMAAVGLASTVASKLLEEVGVPAARRAPSQRASRPARRRSIPGASPRATPFTRWPSPRSWAPSCRRSRLLLLPFTFAVAASRVVLGLHYPSDVAAGAAIGLAPRPARSWLPRATCASSSSPTSTSRASTASPLPSASSAASSRPTASRSSCSRRRYGACRRRGRGGGDHVGCRGGACRATPRTGASRRGA